MFNKAVPKMLGRFFRNQNTAIFMDIPKGIAVERVAIPIHTFLASK